MSSSETPKPVNEGLGRQPATSTASQPPPPEAITSAADTPDRSLPPYVPVLIAVVIIGIFVAALLYFTRPAPIASGTINKIVPIEQASKDRVLVSMEATVKNLMPKPLWIRGLEVKVVTPQGEFTDAPAAAADLPRYYQAFPALKQSDAPPLIDNTRIEPGHEQPGVFIVGFPFNKEAFDKRTSLEVIVHIYGQRPLILKQ